MYVNNTSSNKEPLSIEDFNKYVHFWPDKELIPNSLIKAVYDGETDNEWFNYRGSYYYFIAQDLNNDSELNYIVIEENNYSTTANLWLLKDDKWNSKYMKTNNPKNNKIIKGLLLNNEVDVIQPKYKHLKVGDLTFRVEID